MSTLPKTRTDEVAVQNLGNQIFVYDRSIDKLHCLNKTLTTVYRACLRQMSFEQLGKQSNLSVKAIFSALVELKKENLLEQSSPGSFGAATGGGGGGERVLRKVDFVEWLNSQSGECL